jgi:hypothetical protein
MPNWCTNAILFKGNSEEVTKLIETVKADEGDSTLSLKKIIAVPEELTQLSAPNRDEDQKERLAKLYGAVDWYDFQVKNWGTKWDVDARVIYDSNEQAIGYKAYTDPGERFVHMEFDSAWSPPVFAIDMLAKQFPKVKIHHTYDESGSDFSGYRMYIGGELVESKDYDSWTNVRMYLEPSEDIFEMFPTQTAEGEQNETVSHTADV